MNSPVWPNWVVATGGHKQIHFPKCCVLFVWDNEQRPKPGASKCSTRWAFYVQHNIEVCLCHHCCHGKAVSIKYCECVCSLKCLACNAHVPYCHLLPVQIFFHFISNGTFSKKKLLNIKCVFWLPLQCLSETFHILRRIEWYVIKNWIFLTDFLKILIYQISWKSMWWEPSYFMQMDTWREMTKLIVTFHSFVNTSNNIVRTL